MVEREYRDYLFRSNYKPKYLNNIKDKFRDLYIKEYNVKSFSQITDGFYCVLYNIVRAYNYGCVGLYVSRDYNFYKTDVIFNGKVMNFRIGYESITKTLDFLEKYNFIESSKGFYVSDRHKKTGHITFRPALIELIEDNVDKSKLKFKLLENVVVLRDVKGENLPFRRTKEIRSMIDLINSYNAFMEGVEVTFQGKRLNTQVHRSFSRSSFDKGGRYYSSGRGIQQLSKQDREYVLIDGEFTVEMDFKALHPSILYEKEGIVLDENFDVYGGESAAYNFQVVPDVVLKRREIDRKYNPVRNFLKKTLLVMINGRSSGQVAGKMQQLLLEDRQKPEDEQDFAGLVDVDPYNAIEFLSDHNEMISKYFHSDAGIDLQRLDSDIISMVIEYCVQREIPILTVHDSVIVPQSHVGEVLSVMKASYKSVVGSDFNCRIEV